MLTVGISAHYHDSACCVLRDGELVAAAQEERFSRVKHDASLPVRAFGACLRQVGATVEDVDCIAYYERPELKLERQLAQLWPALTEDECLTLWHRARLPLETIRRRLGFDGEILAFEHHLSHAASAFLFSGFDEAAILTVDGVGEWSTTAYGRGREDVELFEQVRFPHSLGLLYSTITNYLGFGVNDGEYKVMGLAPYGQPRQAPAIRTLVESGTAGSFTLDTRYFDFRSAEGMHAAALEDLLEVPPRRRGDPLLPVHHDLARSVQLVLEELLLEKVRYLHDRVPVDALCMAGGVALNCVANGRIVREGPFKRLFVQPAAGDAGGALGAAALAERRHRPGGRIGVIEHVYLGPRYSNRQVADLFDLLGITPMDFREDEPGLLAAAVDRLAAGKVIGWFQGAMEFGPRALGARSILADPRLAGMRDHVNAMIKDREGFRPFAPAVLATRLRDHFELSHPSPFMLETCQVNSALPLPAITHVDGTARVQTVDGRAHARFAALLEAFAARTGCPLLLNTSFNLRDEPIVESPVDAVLSFACSQMDALVIEDYILDRAGLTPGLLAAARQPRPRAAEESRVYTF